MEDPTKNDAADSELQFDQAEFGDPEAGLQCTSCSKPIMDTYHEINGHVVCESCHEQTMALRTGGSGLARFIRATVFGAVAAAVGAGIYYGIVALTGYEIGLIAILVGFMVGFAVNAGSLGRGGWSYQLLAVLLTYTSIVSAYAPQVAEGLRQIDLEAPVVDTVVESEGVIRESTTEESAAEESITEESTPGEFDEMASENTALSSIGFWIVVALLSFVVPFLSGFQNIIGILIIGFGLWQAWQMNRKQPFEVTGPFQVGAVWAGDG